MLPHPQGREGRTVSREPHSVPQLPQWPFVCVTLAAAMALALLNTLQAGVDLAFRGQRVPWEGLLKASTVEWLDYALFVLPLWLIVGRFPFRADKWRFGLALYLAVGAFVALTIEYIFVLVGNVFRPGVFHLESILSEDFSSELLISWSLIGLIHASRYYLWCRELEADADCTARGTKSRELKQIAVPGRVAHSIVSVSDIELIVSEGNYVRIETQVGSYLIRHTLTGIEAQLDDRFLRVHRRQLINLAHVAAFESGQRGEYRISMRSGRQVSSARSFNATVRSALRAIGQTKA
jgi:hypothetical protein